MRYRHLDPKKNISKINYNVDSPDDLEKIIPFEHIEDSAAYIREIRKNAWRRKPQKPIRLDTHNS